MTEHGNIAVVARRKPVHADASLMVVKHKLVRKMVAVLKYIK